MVRKKKMSYYENYLTSEHWKEVKRECKEIGLFSKCIICGKSGKIDLHHLNYNNMQKEDILKDIVPLCHRCHFDIVHKKLKELNIKELTRLEFNYLFLRNQKIPKWIKRLYYPEKIKVKQTKKVKNYSLHDKRRNYLEKQLKEEQKKFREDLKLRTSQEFKKAINKWKQTEEYRKIKQGLYEEAKTVIN